MPESADSRKLQIGPCLLQRHPQARGLNSRRLQAFHARSNLQMLISLSLLYTNFIIISRGRNCKNQSLQLKTTDFLEVSQVIFDDVFHNDAVQSDVSSCQKSLVQQFISHEVHKYVLVFRFQLR